MSLSTLLGVFSSNRIRNVNPKKTTLALAVLAAAAISNQALAGPLYWDANGAGTAGAGATPTGIWGTDAFWNDSATGSGGSLTSVTTQNDDLFVVAGPSGTSGNNATTITVNGTQLARSINFQASGAMTLSGGTINLYSGGIVLPINAFGATANGSHIINSRVVVQESQAWSVGSGRTLTLGGGLTEATASTLTLGGGGSYVFTDSASLVTPTVSHSGGTTIQDGSTVFLNIRGVANTNHSFGNSGNTITLNNGTMVFRGFTNIGGANFQIINNAIQVNSGGGRLNLIRNNNEDHSQRLTGNITLDGDFIIRADTGGTANEHATSASVTMNGNRQITFDLASTFDFKSTFNQDAGNRTLTLTHSTGSTAVGRVSGTMNISNIVLAANGANTRVKFGAAASLPTNLTVNTGTYAGIDYTPANQAALDAVIGSNITANSTGILGLDWGNTALNLDLATAGRDLRIGTVDSLTYTGTITPFNNVYKIGGGGGTITFSNANTFNGPGRSVDIRNQGAVSFGLVSISGTTNGYDGDTTINISGVNFRPGTGGSRQVEVTANGAISSLGSGDLVIERGQIRFAPSSNSATATTISKGVEFGAEGFSEITLHKNSNAGASLQFTASSLNREGHGGLFIGWTNGTLGTAGANPRFIITGQAATTFLSPYIVVGDGSTGAFPMFAAYDATNGVTRVSSTVNGIAGVVLNNGTENVVFNGTSNQTMTTDLHINTLSFREPSNSNLSISRSGTADTIVLAGGGLITAGTGSKTINADLVFGSESTPVEAVIWSSAGQSFSLASRTELSGNITAAGLTKLGVLLKTNDAGTGRTMLVLSGSANNISGRYAVNEGGLAFTNAGAIGNSNTVYTTTAADVYFNVNETIRGLEGTGGLGSSLNSSGTFTRLLTLDTAGNSYASAISLRNESTANGRLFALTKTGSGTQQLSGVSTYTGATNVTGGTLHISGAGSINNTSGITVNGVGAKFMTTSSVAVTAPITLTQGTIGGTGTVTSAVTIGANNTIAPGTSPGAQSYANLTWADSGTYEWEINNATGTAGNASGWDLINITSGGLFNITATSGNPFTIKILGLTAGNASGIVPNFNNASNYSWLILDHDTAITGFSADKFTLDPAGFTNNNGLNGGSFAIVQGTGGNNDKLYLTFTAGGLTDPTISLTSTASYANLADAGIGNDNPGTGGTGTITIHNTGGTPTEIDGLTGDSNQGSAAIGYPGGFFTVNGDYYVMLWMTGTGSISDLVAALETAGDVGNVYDISDNDLGDDDTAALAARWNLYNSLYGNFDILVRFNNMDASDVRFLNWNFANTVYSGLQVDQVAVIPEPTSLGLLGLGAMGLLARRRRK